MEGGVADDDQHHCGDEDGDEDGHRLARQQELNLSQYTHTDHYRKHMQDGW